MSCSRQWRDCKEWKDQGLSISTTSNEAAKLFDAALTQYVSWREIDSLGGLDNTLEDLKIADPNFGFGHILSNALRFIATGTPPSRDQTFRQDLDITYDVCSKSPLNEREKLHLEALKCLDDGFMTKACRVYEEILRLHPTDMLAIKLAHDLYFYLGDKSGMIGSLMRVSGAWKDSLPLYGFLYGMKAFAFCENGDFIGSEAAARKGLELNPNDAWSTHALAHDFEMTGRYVEGEKFLNDTILDWEVCNMLSCHIHWHNSVYAIEKGEYDKALSIFDDKISTSALNSGAMLDLVDACSILYRLQMEGQNVKDRFKQLNDICTLHMDDRVLTFNDLHFLMTFLGTGNTVQAEAFVDSLKHHISSSTSSGGPIKDYASTNDRFGIPISKAMLSFQSGEYDRVVELLGQVDGEIVEIGGSDAQRDLFDQLFVNAAIHSTDSRHLGLAENLIKRRMDKRAESPLTDRLMEKFLTVQKSREAVLKL